MTDPGRRPSVTPAQIVAVLIAGIPIIANLLGAFDVYTVTTAQQHALSDATTWGGLFAGLLVGGDALVRTGRNYADARVQAAALTPAAPSAQQAPQVVPVTVDLDREGIWVPGHSAMTGTAVGEALPTDAEEFDNPPPESAAAPDEPQA